MSQTISKPRKVIDTYVNLIKKNRTIPSLFDLSIAGIKRSSIQYHFGSLTNLTNALKKARPALFKNLRKSSTQSDQVVQSIMRLVNEA